jgi:hypothetical protein
LLGVCTTCILQPVHKQFFVFLQHKVLAQDNISLKLKTFLKIERTPGLNSITRTKWTLKINPAAIQLDSKLEINWLFQLISKSVVYGFCQQPSKLDSTLELNYTIFRSSTANFCAQNKLFLSVHKIFLCIIEQNSKMLPSIDLRRDHWQKTARLILLKIGQST